MTSDPTLIRLATSGGRLAAYVAPDMGAELSGLEWNGVELLHRGRDFTPATGWTGRAPILWPSIGRTFAPGAEPTGDNFKDAPLGWLVDGALYPMPIHGFARGMPWAVESQTSSSLRLTLTDGARTRVFYPYGFRLTLDIAVEDDRVVLTHRVEASADNTASMPFALGNHATFKTPLPGFGALDDTTVQTSGRSRMTLDAAGRPAGGSAHEERFAEPTPVTDIATFDVIPLTSPDAPSWGLLRTGGLMVRVAQSTFGGGDIPEMYLTLWGDPPGGYLSLETWLGKPNALATGDGACCLAPGEALVWTLTMSVEETAT